MAIKLLIDYLTGKQALVNNLDPATTKFELTLDYLSGQLALVLVQGVTPPPTDGGWGLLLALRNTE